MGGAVKAHRYFNSFLNSTALSIFCLSIFTAPLGVWASVPTPTTTPSEELDFRGNIDRQFQKKVLAGKALVEEPLVQFQGRFQFFGPGFGKVFSNDLYTSFFLQMSFRYYWSETWAWDIFHLEWGESWESSTLKDLETELKRKVTSPAPALRGAYGSRLVYSPIYGKYQVFGHIIRFHGAGILGVGVRTSSVDQGIFLETGLEVQNHILPNVYAIFLQYRHRAFLSEGSVFYEGLLGLGVSFWL